MPIEHDKDCPGCATDRRMEESGGSFVRDYLAYCYRCKGVVQGDTEHSVNGVTYHDVCVPAEAAIAAAPPH
jgi:hypothetical protein